MTYSQHRGGDGTGFHPLIHSKCRGCDRVTFQRDVLLSSCGHIIWQWGCVMVWSVCGKLRESQMFLVLSFSILQFLVMPRSAGGRSSPAVLILVRRIVLRKGRVEDGGQYSHPHLGWEDGVRGNDRYCLQELHNTPTTHFILSYNYNMTYEGVFF